MSDYRKVEGHVAGVEDVKTASATKADQVFEPAPAYQTDEVSEKDEKRDPRTRLEMKDHSAVVSNNASNPASKHSKPEVDTSSKQQPSLDELYDAAAKNTICALGPRKSFFYWCGEVPVPWNYQYKESECPHAVSGVALSKWMIKKPYQVALSPHGAAYFAYTSYSGGLTWRFLDISPIARPKRRKARKQFDKAVEAYILLKKWLLNELKSDEDIKLTRVVFGPMARYMAWKPDGTYISNALPVSLQNELEERKSTQDKFMLPRCLAFGHGEAWAAIWQDGSHHLSLDNKYPVVEETISKMKTEQLIFIALDCCSTESQHLLHFSKGISRYRMPNSRLEKVQAQWDSQVMKWSRDLDMTISSSLQTQNGCSVKRVSPKDATAAEAALSALEAKNSEQLAQDAALLSIQSSQKSIAASKVAVTAGVFAIATGCTVM